MTPRSTEHIYTHRHPPPSVMLHSYRILPRSESNFVIFSCVLQVIPGNALAVDKSKQFRPLSKFGGAFLNRFQCSLLRSPVLKCVTMVDTPGILSGEKQRVDRGYDFVGVLRWFAERVDRIILLFDANKLDISDEFRRSIEAIHVSFD